MHFYSDLYLDEKTKKNSSKIKKALLKRKPSFDILGAFLLILPKNPTQLLEIVAANVYLQPYFKNKDADVCVIGIASSKDSAIDISSQIIEKMYKDTGGFDIRSYLCDRD